MGASNTLTQNDIAELLGCTSADLPKICLDRIANCNLGYSALTSEQRDNHILKVLMRLENDGGINRTTAQNIQAFESGWAENLDLCRREGVNRKNLRPKYVRPYDCIRFRSDYIAPANPYLLDDLLWLTVHYSFLRYFQSVESIYEFGCGTGQYLFDLAQLFPEKNLIGTDWTQSSVDLLQLMAESGIKVRGERFDMLNPNLQMKIAPKSGVLTVGALEQIGPNYGAFLEYLVAQKPEVVVHHEPIEDFYGHDTLVDFVGFLYHRRRGYLREYLPALQNLERRGAIEILDARRIPFGDPFHESASRIVWRPR